MWSLFCLSFVNARILWMKWIHLQAFSSSSSSSSTWLRSFVFTLMFLTVALSLSNRNRWYVFVSSFSHSITAYILTHRCILYSILLCIRIYKMKQHFSSPQPQNHNNNNNNKILVFGVAHLHNECAHARGHKGYSIILIWRKKKGRIERRRRRRKRKEFCVRRVATASSHLYK